MFKRSTATVLWFFATWCMWELVAYFTGWPRLVGPVLATAAAATIGFDPMRAIWPGAMTAARIDPRRR